MNKAQQNQKQPANKAAFILAVYFCLKRIIATHACLPGYKVFTQPRVVPCKWHHKAHNLVFGIWTVFPSRVDQRSPAQEKSGDNISQSRLQLCERLPDSVCFCYLLWWQCNATATLIPCCVCHYTLLHSNYDWGAVIRAEAPAYLQVRKGKCGIRGSKSVLVSGGWRALKILSIFSPTLNHFKRKRQCSEQQNKGSRDKHTAFQYTWTHETRFAQDLWNKPNDCTNWPRLAFSGRRRPLKRMDFKLCFFVGCSSNIANPKFCQNY